MKSILRDQAEWRIAWCPFCSSAMRIDSTACPTCRLSPISASEARPSSLFSRLTVRHELESLIPDLKEIANVLSPSDFQKHLLDILSTSLDEINNEVTQDFVGKVADLYEGILTQPSETARTLLLEVLIQMSYDGQSIGDLLNRPTLCAAKIDATAVEKEMERRALQDPLPGKKYEPLAKLELDCERPCLRKMLIYLAALDAMSGNDWQSNFQRTLKAGAISEEEIVVERARVRQLLSEDSQVKRPDTPWRETLAACGETSLPAADVRSFICCAGIALRNKNYAVAEDIAKASLRLVQEEIDAGGVSGIATQKEQFEVVIRSIISRCCDNESEQSASKSAFLSSMKKMVASFLPEELREGIGALNSSCMDATLEMTFAEGFVRDGRVDEALLKYNRVIFTVKETLERVARMKERGEHDNVEMASSLVDHLHLVKAYIKLAELKLGEDDADVAEQYLLSARRYLNQFEQDNKYELQCMEYIHSPLPPAIEGCLFLVYKHQKRLAKSIRAIRRARKALNNTKPLQMSGFVMDYQRIIDEHDKMRAHCR